MNHDEISEITEFNKSEMKHIDKSIVRPPTQEVLDQVEETNRKICTGEWDGLETPYVKFIKKFYKDRWETSQKK
jgi:hypothetical protein